MEDVCDTSSGLESSASASGGRDGRSPLSPVAPFLSLRPVCRHLQDTDTYRDGHLQSLSSLGRGQGTARKQQPLQEIRLFKYMTLHLEVF